MKTFIALLTFTERGIAGIQNSPARAGDFAKSAEKLGIAVKQQYWTVGAYDGVLIFEAPDDEAAAAALLSLGASCNVRSQSLLAYEESAFSAILGKLG
ncbi:MAG: GYD domain-containing protein [Opitutales bacterium]